METLREYLLQHTHFPWFTNSISLTIPSENVS